MEIKNNAKYKEGTEIEFKLLIEAPDFSALAKLEGAETRFISHFYYLNEDKDICRIGYTIHDGHYTLKKTTKHLISPGVRNEIIEEMNIGEYMAEFNRVMPLDRVIVKSRITLPLPDSRKLEVDYYGEDMSKTLAEVEVGTVEELQAGIDSLNLPDFIHVIKDVTYDEDYMNYNLAKNLSLLD